MRVNDGITYEFARGSRKGETCHITGWWEVWPIVTTDSDGKRLLLCDPSLDIRHALSRV